VIPEIVDEDSVQKDFSTENESPLPSETFEDEDDLQVLSVLENEAPVKPVKSLATKRKTESREITTSDPVAIYLSEIRKYPVLTKEQEQTLAKHYFETKDPKAAQALVTANLRFVVKVAAEYSKFGAKMIDLIQEGNVGLMHAVKEFNPYKEVRLITYAVWWIRGYIQEYLMKQYSMVKIGTTQNQRKLFYQLQKEKNSQEFLTTEGQYAQLSTELGIPKEEIIEMSQRIRGRDVSLNQPLDSNSDNSILDFQIGDPGQPDDVLAHHEDLTILKNEIDSLKPELSAREIIILEERLLADEPLTLQEIGEKYNITREAVRQMEVRLMNKIKARFKEKSGK
jgi:RNA polymerase sigma-32 factor